MSNQLLTGNQIQNGVSPAFTTVTPFTANRSSADVDNNAYLISQATGAITLTLTSTCTQGFTCVLANRGSAAISITCTSGVYKNGASSTTTSGSLAQGGKITLFHEGSGVWTADGSGLT